VEKFAVRVKILWKRQSWSMPIYRLIDEIVFPPPDHAEPDGLLAVGGDLSRYFLFYNTEGRHQGLGKQTPAQVYFG